jgi:hypothetical protein
MRGRAVAFLLTALASAGLLAWGIYRAEFAGVLLNGAPLRLSCIGFA